jgi:secreted Zn-dependent insulinase-like peptidase
MYQTLRHAKNRAEVTITVDYLMDIFEKQQGKCALSGVEMTWHKGKILPTSISIDRIDNSKGYVEGNVRLVCVVVNAFKSTQTDDELYEFAKCLVENMAKTKPN